MFCFAKQKLLITSDNTAYLVTAFIQKPPPKLLTQLQILRNVIRNSKNIFLSV